MRLFILFTQGEPFPFLGKLGGNFEAKVIIKRFQVKEWRRESSVKIHKKKYNI